MDGTVKTERLREQKCLSCQKPVIRYLAGQANYIACSSCNCWMKITSNGSFQKMQRPPKNWFRKDDPLKPGVKMRFGETDYIVVSAAEKADKNAQQFSWREYGLFHPEKGYLFLSEYDGHWMKLQRTTTPENEKGRVRVHKGRQFRLFQRSDSIVLTARGEFADNIFDKQVRYSEYIDPPYFLSLESSGQNREWYLGEYMEPGEIMDALPGKTGILPKRIGVGAIQPQRRGYSQQTILHFSLILLGLLLLLELVFSMSAEGKTVVSMNNAEADSVEIVSPSFELTGLTSNLQFDYSSPVNNNWAEADIMLINETTGEMRGLTAGVEYYSGVDDGEAWSEGSSESDFFLSHVAPGKYHLNIKTSHGNSGTGRNYFSLNVKHDVPVLSNFFLIAILIMLFPAINYMLARQFEKRRWENSDFSPYYLTET